MTALYIGGAHQNKKVLVKTIHGENCPIVTDLHEKVRQHLKDGKDPMQLLQGLHDKVVICNEIGCGIVPLDPFEREWREKTGRLCCELAAQADLVVRVVAGIPQVLKGELP